MKEVTGVKCLLIFVVAAVSVCVPLTGAAQTPPAPDRTLDERRLELDAGKLALDRDRLSLDRANAELPPFPEVTSPAPVHTAFFFSAPGSVHRATHSGTWGDAREATPEYGERYLEVVTTATIRMLDDIERTFEAMPPR